MSATRTFAEPAAALGQHEFAAIARLVHGEAGIVLNSQKIALTQGRLAKRMRALGLTDFGRYVATVEADADERRRMVDALTTNHTAFFREPHHFRHLADVSLPELVARAFAGGRLRIWSSASSTGEEPYSIAAVLLHAARRMGGPAWLGRADIAILATDLAAHAVDAGRLARYPAAAEAAFPAALRSDALANTAAGIEMSAAARALVHFRHLNLLGDWPLSGKFDIIFCRNVTIYFDEPTKVKLWTRFVDALAPAGWLYIGHSERIAGPAAARVRSVGQTVYRNIGEQS